MQQLLDDEDVFDRLKRYYNDQHYRFEVPSSNFETLRSFLADHGYGLVIIDVVAEFVVVVKKYPTIRRTSSSSR